MCLYAAVSFLLVALKNGSRTVCAFGFRLLIPLALLPRSFALANFAPRIRTRSRGDKKPMLRDDKPSPWGRPSAAQLAQFAPAIAEPERASSGSAAVLQRSQELLALLSRISRPHSHQPVPSSQLDEQSRKT